MPKKWDDVHFTKVDVDPRSREAPVEDNPQLIGVNKPLAQCTTADFLKLFLPLEFLKKKVVPWTNERLRNGKRYHVTNLKELSQLLGIMLMMRNTSKDTSKEDMWEPPQKYQNSPNLGQYNMSYTRFNLLFSNIAFVSLGEENRKAKERQDEIDEDYDVTMEDNPQFDQEEVMLKLKEERSMCVPSLWAINALIEAFNEIRQKHFVPGRGLCIDESMVKWLGKDWRHVSGLPAVTKVKGKPEPVGLLLFAMCCAKTGIMLNVIPRGNKFDKIKAYSGYQEHVAVTLRLAAPYSGTGRTICADSYFRSVSTATALKQEMGLWSIMVVKRNSMWYPKRFIDDLMERLRKREHERGTEQKSVRGQFKAGTAEHTNLTDQEPVQLLATSWQDHSVLRFISTCGTTLLGQPRQKVMWRNDATKSHRHIRSIQRPTTVEEYSKVASAVDLHNQYRQGTLELERCVRTNRWEIRTLTSLFSMAVTDAFFAQRYFGNDDLKKMPFKVYIREVAKCLIEGTILDDLENDDNEEEDGLNEGLGNDICTMVKLQEHHKTQKEIQLRCMHYKMLNERKKPGQTKHQACGIRTTFFCQACLNTTGRIYPICNAHRIPHALHVFQCKSCL